MMKRWGGDRRRPQRAFRWWARAPEQWDDVSKGAFLRTVLIQALSSREAWHCNERLDERPMMGDDWKSVRNGGFEGERERWDRVLR
jgi:hypothetical protein